jgi:hypothetical protein
MWTFIRSLFREAWRESLTQANSWGSLLGAAVIAGVGYVTGAQFAMPNGWLGVLCGVPACIAVSWVVIFVVRFLFAAPFQLYGDVIRQRDDARSECDQLRAVIENAAPLVFAYNPSDPQFVHPRGAARIEYCIGIQNTLPTRTVHGAIVSSEARSQFVRCLASFQRPQRVGVGPISINPLAMVWVRIEIPRERSSATGMSDADAEILGKPHTFTLWASGDDVQERKLVLDHVPNEEPHIRLHPDQRRKSNED